MIGSQSKFIIWTISKGYCFSEIEDSLSTECLRMMYTLFETFLDNEMIQKYNFCCLWSRRHWKCIATRSCSSCVSTNMAVNVSFDERKWLLKCYWKVENVFEVQWCWSVEFGTPPPTRITNKNPRQVWSRWNGARHRKRVLMQLCRFLTIPKEVIEAMFSWDWYREIQCSSNFTSSKMEALHSKPCPLTKWRRPRYATAILWVVPAQVWRKGRFSRLNCLVRWSHI